MLIENQSKYNYEETEKKFIEAIEKNNWNLISTLNFKETMLKFGKEIKPAKVFEICRPEHAYKILKENNERIVSSLMPCRISIYEKNDGKVYISRMSSGEMSKIFGGIVEEMMSQASSETEQIINEIINY